MKNVFIKNEQKNVYMYLEQIKITKDLLAKFHACKPIIKPCYR